MVPLQVAARLAERRPLADRHVVFSQSLQQFARPPVLVVFCERKTLSSDSNHVAIEESLVYLSGRGHTFGGRPEALNTLAVWQEM